MDKRIQRLDTVKKCENFARNATEKGRPDLAKEATQRAGQIRAQDHGATSAAETEALQAVYAYEVLFQGDLVFRDKSYQYRSTITHYVLDCDKQEGVMLSVSYYDGDMSKGNLVLFEQPNDVYWSDILFFIEPQLTSAVCERPSD